MEEKCLYPFVSDGSLRSVEFSIATMDEIHKSSLMDCPISNPSQLLANGYLGLPLESGGCHGCGTSENGKCEGHFGYIKLPVPVYHPLHVSEVRQILSSLCLNCLKMKKEKVKENRGKEASSTTSCPYCQVYPPIKLKEVKTTDGALCLELRVPSRAILPERFWSFLDKFGFRYGDTKSRPLLPIEALKLLDEIPEKTKKRLVSKGLFPQNGFILQCLPVPPNCLTIPEISDGTSNMTTDISTSMLKKLLNKTGLIEKSRSGAPNFEAHVAESIDLQSSIGQYLLLRGTPKDISRRYGVGPDASAGSARRWLEKMKTLFISKGSGFCSRSIITGDSYIGINEIGLPSEIASRMTFEERVTVHNMNRLQKMVDDRKCVTYKVGNQTYAIAVGAQGHTFLQVGQLINRQIMDGDIVFINRPPSTHKHSVQAFSVYIHDDHTVKMNPLICPSFGADFDGDCVHIFYPQSLAAKAEVVELFSVEKQLLSSHNGNIHLQFVHDSLLALKLMSSTFLLNKPTAQQFAFCVSPGLPQPALFKNKDSGHIWTVLQIMQGALPEALKSLGPRHMIDNSEIVGLDLDRDVVQSSVGEIVTSIFEKSGPKASLNFFNAMQPLLMEILFSEGYSITLEDFNVRRCEVEEIRKNIQNVSLILRQQRSEYSENMQLQVDNALRCTKRQIETFILKSAMGNLIDSRSESSITKVVQQIGFLGRELYERGKLYSKYLVDEIYSHIIKRYSLNGDHPCEAYGVIKNSFINGLNCNEMLIHSVSSREVMVRSSRGLTEPGILFKNLMATLRDVVICYDGTVRNVCSNSLVQLTYGSNDRESSSPGEPVGVLAATAISTPAYKAVLDSTQSTNSSWELMKEILLCKTNYKNGATERRVILYLNDCTCGSNFCKEHSAIALRDCLERVTLKDCATDFLIKFESQSSGHESSKTASCLVGHIHLDKIRLENLKRSTDDILQMCQEFIDIHAKKKGQLSNFFKNINISFSQCSSQCPCLQFSCSNVPGSLEKSIDVMSNFVCPVLLDTILKGDPRILHAKIVWIGPEANSWVRNSNETLKGEVAVEVLTKKDAVRRNGDAWRITLDACLPVMDLVDTRRSIPYGIQQIQELLGISCALDQSVQRLSASIKMVAKGVLKEHLILIGNCMTCTGNLIGFSNSGFRALFRSLKVQVPFTESTLYTPVKCFERAADKLQNDSLASVVSSCSWGKHVGVGTGTPFQIMWDKSQIATEDTNEKDVYDFLEVVRTIDVKRDAASACLGVDVDDLLEEDENNEMCLSPKADGDLEKLSFDDNVEGGLNYQNNAATEAWGHNSSWDRGSAREVVAAKATGWENESQPAFDNRKSQNWENVSTPEVSNNWGAWDDGKKAPTSENTGWETKEKDHPGDQIKKDQSETIWNKNVAPTPKDSPSQKRHNEEIPVRHGWGIPPSGNTNVDSPTSVDRLNAKQGESRASQSKGGWGTPASDVNANISKQEESRASHSQGGWGMGGLEINASIPKQEQGQAQGGWGMHAKEVNTNSSQNGRGEKAIVSKDEGSRASQSKGGWGTSAPDVNANTSKQEESRASHSQGGWGMGGSEINASIPKQEQGQAQGGWGMLAKEVNTNSSKQEEGLTQGGWGMSGSGTKIDEETRWDREKPKNPGNQVWTNARGRNQSDLPSKPGIADDRRRWNSNRNFTPKNLTPEEEKICEKIDPIVEKAKTMLRSYSNGASLSDDDRKYILENVFEHHPAKDTKVKGQIDHITVDLDTEHSQDNNQTKCFFVVSDEGRCRENFSYRKCIQNYVKSKFPVEGELFLEKYTFKPNAPPRNRENSQQHPCTWKNSQQGNNEESPARWGSSQQRNNEELPSSLGSRQQGNNGESPARWGSRQQENNKGSPATRGSRQQENNEGSPATRGSRQQGNNEDSPATWGSRQQGNNEDSPATWGSRQQGNNEGSPATWGSRQQRNAEQPPPTWGNSQQ